ncbi:MAG: hypothetical protein AAFU41_13735 [Pseudomonadota bacterium]
MSGFQHLMFSTLMIATAMVMSVHYTDWSGEISWGYLNSMQGICSNENIAPYLPYWFDCARYEELREFDPDNDARIHQLRQSDRLPQIGDDEEGPLGL